MRKRGVKKMLKNAKRNMTPLRQMRAGGNKANRRRRKAYDRVERAIRREDKRRLEENRQLLKEIDAYEPLNDLERKNLPGLRAQVAETVRIAEAREARRVAMRGQTEKLRRVLNKLNSRKPKTWQEAAEPLDYLRGIMETWTAATHILGETVLGKSPE